MQFRHTCKGLWPDDIDWKCYAIYNGFNGCYKWIKKIRPPFYEEIEHLCEPCMHSLNSEISKAVDLWKQSK